MYGWRGRIGLLVPATDSVCETEFHRLLPEGVSVHTERMMILPDISKEDTLVDWDEAHQIMHSDCMRAAKILAGVEVNVVVFGCTSGGFAGGMDCEDEICKRIEDSIPLLRGRDSVVTTSRAVKDALRIMGIRKVGVATPYIDKGNDQEKFFLEASGFEVLEIAGLGIGNLVEYGKVNPSSIYKLAKKVNRDDVEGIFISCTDFRALDIIETLEKDIGKPVVTSNQAAFWLALKKLGVSEPIKGYGALLQK